VGTHLHVVAAQVLEGFAPLAPIRVGEAASAEKQSGEQTQGKQA